MGRIGFLLIEVAPSALLITLLLWIKYHRSSRKFIGYACFSVYLCAVYALVGLPTVLFLRFDPSLSFNPFTGMVDDLKNTVLNVFLFLPLGFLLPLLWKQYRSLKNTMLFGFGMTFGIEFLQIFTYRATDINDIIANTAGTFLGFLTYKCLIKRLPGPVCTGNARGDLGFLCGVVSMLMFFIQPILSTVIWTIRP